MLIAPKPEILIFPSPAAPAAASLSAYNLTASPLARVETIGSVINKSPESVDNSINPEEVIPVGFTVPTVKEVLFVSVNAPVGVVGVAVLPPAKVPMALEILSKVVLPVPVRANFGADIFPVEDCVILVLALKTNSPPLLSA